MPLAIFLLFLPACIGILSQVIKQQAFDYQLLALGLLIFAIDQARMAVLDLENIAEAKKKVEDIQLNQFYYLTIITIALELIGFYLASIELGWGIIIVLGSQILFNALVNISIHLTKENIIQKKFFSDKILVLMADIVGIVLISFWMVPIMPMTIVLTLWIMAIAYGCIKYFLSLSERKSTLT